ncbi:hypothetical protein HY637_00835, partial [Candidatus Woesearchaeota archaeon]|nr:hypothetical protein [Candidatus Woesearchaeota archaeon]
MATHDPLKEIRSNLSTTTNNDWTAGTTGGGAELQKKIDAMVVDFINRDVDLTPLVARKPMPPGNVNFFWPVKTDLGSTGKAAFYSEGATGTPYPSTMVNLNATPKSLRSDYEVSGMIKAASQGGFYDALEGEAKDALSQLKLVQEQAFICGTDTNAYGFSGSYNGLLQLMRWHTSNGGDTEGTAANKMLDTTSVYGVTRAAGTTYLDVSYVLAGTIGTSTGALELAHLDRAVTLSNKHGGKGH